MDGTDLRHFENEWSSGRSRPRLFPRSNLNPRPKREDTPPVLPSPCPVILVGISDRSRSLKPRRRCLPSDLTDISANSSYITARAEQNSTLTAAGHTRATKDVEEGSGGSGSEASKDTDNSHYPSSLSDDGPHEAPSAHEAAYDGVEEEVSFDDVNTPNASTFNQKLPATKGESDETAETSPVPTKVSDQARGEVGSHVLLVLPS